MSPLPNPQKTLDHVYERGKNHQKAIGRSFQLMVNYSRVSNLQKRRHFLNCLRERGLHSEHLTLWDQELREMMNQKQDS